MSQHTLETKNLSVGYEDKIIVKDLSIVPPNGEITVILGANGCGKSTLLKSMARLLKPLSGTVTLDDRKLMEYPQKELAKKLGLLPQSPVVPDGIRVADLVARSRFPYQKFMQGLSKQDYEKVEEALELLGISHLADIPVDELSGGQRQRVWIALALAQDTDVLLLDEPTTYLDIAYQIEILDTLKEINQKRTTTIVMVLHDINLSVRYADHIIAMKEGRLIAQGKPKELITAELMKEIYGLSCKVFSDPLSGDPWVIPLSGFMKR